MDETNIKSHRDMMADQAIGLNIIEDFSDQYQDPRRVLLQSRRIDGNESKRRIARDMLERYTGLAVDKFEKQVIITNFHYYVQRFDKMFKDAQYTEGSAFKASTSKEAHVTIIEFGIGAAMAALIGELISVTKPKAVLFLGLAGAVHPNLHVGDFIVPIASIRAEGVTRHFLPPEVPALPSFQIQKFVAEILTRENIEYRNGTLHTTDFRFWEFDDSFKSKLIEERVMAVEMETAALFASCFVSKVPIGALILISDCPMKRGGIKTKKTADDVFKKYTDQHIELGIKAMREISDNEDTMRHYSW